MDMELSGETALVTASSRGLGKAAAFSLGREGANVVVNGRDGAQVESTVDQIADETGAAVVGVPGDLSDSSDISRLVDRTVSAFDGLDHLVVSSGGPPVKSAMETTDQEWYDAFDLLVMSVLRLVRESVEYLRDGEGTILAITSKAVKEANPGNVLSSSVRMSVVGLQQCLAEELAPSIRVNSLLPGGFHTDRAEAYLEGLVDRGEYDEFDEALADRAGDLPLERLGAPRELGDMVVQLCSPRSGYVTGQAIVVDGGLTKSTL